MAVTPKALFHDLPEKIQYYTYGDKPSYSQIYRRMNTLKEKGFLEKHPDADSLYQLSDRGIRYLDDENASLSDFMPDEDSDDDEDNDS